MLEEPRFEMLLKRGEVVAPRRGETNPHPPALGRGGRGPLPDRAHLGKADVQPDCHAVDIVDRIGDVPNLFPDLRFGGQRDLRLC